LISLSIIVIFRVYFLFTNLSKSMDEEKKDEVVEETTEGEKEEAGS